MTRISMDTPTVLSFSTEEMSQERDALLLECGAYPDKGLSVTEEDLDGIVARFSAEGAPIKVEHMDTPLDPLGRVQRIWREGSTLMAKLLFPEDLAGFLRRRGVQKLSVGQSREAVGLALTEVSLVLKPRVAAAAMFGEEALEKRPTPQQAATLPKGEGEEEPTPQQAATLPKGEGEEEPTPQQAATLPKGEGKEEPTPQQAATLPKGEGKEADSGAGKDREIARLSGVLMSREVEGQIASLKAAGRLVPATEHLARALLSVPHSALTTLTESVAPLPVSQVFLSYLEAQAPVVVFGEMALSGSGAVLPPETRSHHHAKGDLPALTADEEAFLKRLGLEPANVQHMMRHGTLPTAPKTAKGN